MKKILVSMLLFLAIGFTSCSSNLPNLAYDGDEIFLFSDCYLLKDGDSYQFHSFDGDETRGFITDPFDDESVSVLCADEDRIFYQNSRREILFRDRKTDQESVFFRPAVDARMSLLGLVDAVTTSPDSSYGYSLRISGMYIDHGIGYVVYNKQLCKLDHGRYQPVFDSQIESIRFDGQKVFFVDSAHNLCSCNPDGTDLVKLVGDKVENQFQVYHNRLWYRPLSQLGSLWNCSFEGADNVCWSDDGVYGFRLAEDNVFFLDKERNLYQSKVEAKSPVLLCAETVIDFYVVPSISTALVRTEKNPDVLTEIEYEPAG